jgi:ABC-type glycerol-3-phosphate transport system substrate-binding protein
VGLYPAELKVRFRHAAKRACFFDNVIQKGFFQMLRKSLLFAVVMLFVLALSPAAAQDTTTIRYFTFSAAPDHVEDLDTIVQAFQAENPTIQVSVETAPFADYFTLLQAGIASGDAPDVFELNYENFVTYATIRAHWKPSATTALNTRYPQASLMY